LQAIIHYLLTRLREFSDWGQCIVLELVAKYKTGEAAHEEQRGQRGRGEGSVVAGWASPVCTTASLTSGRRLQHERCLAAGASDAASAAVSCRTSSSSCWHACRALCSTPQRTPPSVRCSSARRVRGRALRHHEPPGPTPEGGQLRGRACLHQVLPGPHGGSARDPAPGVLAPQDAAPAATRSHTPCSRTSCSSSGAPTPPPAPPRPPPLQWASPPPRASLTTSSSSSSARCGARCCALLRAAACRAGWRPLGCRGCIGLPWLPCDSPRLAPWWREMLWL